MDFKMNMIKRKEIASEIMELSSNILNVRYVYLSNAIANLVVEENPDIYFGTDGEKLYYDVESVIEKYMLNTQSVKHTYLHSLIHCVFRHMYVTVSNPEIWDLACDIAVEVVVAEILNVETSIYVRSLENKVKYLTAEHIYEYFMESNREYKNFLVSRKEVVKDDHSLWYTRETREKQAKENESEAVPLKSELLIAKKGENEDSNVESDLDFEKKGIIKEAHTGSEQNWKEISEQLVMELQSLSNLQGDGTGSLVANLNSINREKHDYTAFLKKFAVLQEAMKINDEEFDYVFYMYGINLYKRLPLIEPLEYKEIKVIRDFAIVIDTSRSVQGDLVQAFLNKTYNILKTSESFQRKVNIHIIQCDEKIQSHFKINDLKELEKYFTDMQIIGFGGTDFRPAFNYIDKLVKEKEFNNLKGIIYFTDGYGHFPKRKPAYETAFVFVDNGYEIPPIPPWAIKIVLDFNESI